MGEVMKQYLEHELYFPSADTCLELTKVSAQGFCYEVNS